MVSGLDCGWRGRRSPTRPSTLRLRLRGIVFVPSGRLTALGVDLMPLLSGWQPLDPPASPQEPEERQFFSPSVLRGEYQLEQSSSSGVGCGPTKPGVRQSPSEIEASRSGSRPQGPVPRVVRIGRIGQGGAGRQVEMPRRATRPGGDAAVAPTSLDGTGAAVPTTRGSRSAVLRRGDSLDGIFAGSSEPQERPGIERWSPPADRRGDLEREKSPAMTRVRARAVRGSDPGQAGGPGS